MSLLAGLLMLGMIQADGAVRTVPKVDLERYAGEWFEVARYPNRFQRDCVGDVAAKYALRPDGRIDVTNSCRKADGTVKDARGVARVVDTATSAKLKVRFAPAFLSFLSAVWGDYWVIGLAPDYSWAVVGSPDREYLWILSRTKTLSTAQYDAAIETVKANGFDPARLVPTN